jgi:hypothetical protein
MTSLSSFRLAHTGYMVGLFVLVPFRSMLHRIHPARRSSISKLKDFVQTSAPIFRAATDPALVFSLILTSAWCGAAPSLLVHFAKNTVARCHAALSFASPVAQTQTQTARTIDRIRDNSA